MFKQHLRFLMGLKGAFLGLLLLTIAGCRQPRIPEYQAFENFRINQVGLKESVVSADLKYYNPNEFALQLKGAELDVTLNERHVGRSILDTLITIPRKDTFLLPVKMKVDMKQLFSNALSMLLNPEVEVKVNGSVKLGKNGVFFNMPVNYKGTQQIEW